MRIKFLSLVLISFLIPTVQSYAQDSLYHFTGKSASLTVQGASALAVLPLKCLDKEFPYKTGITFLDSSQVADPKSYHPAFFGCFDWHSSVHGHWMLAKLVKQFPAMPEAATIRKRLAQHLSAENIRTELKIFQAENLSFERTYGWGWLLYLQRELLTWNDPLGKSLSQNLEPLAGYLSKAYVAYLGKIAYPIRVGEHSNLAYGLSFAWDYSIISNDTSLQNAVKKVSLKFYRVDKNCPISYEPGGSDFLSPCLEEARLMSRLLDTNDYKAWLKQFIPALLTNPDQLFTIAIVNDRTDGKLVHLDGLNMSRASCLVEIADKIWEPVNGKMRAVALKHLQSALPNVLSGNYAGEHWLASFAVFAIFR